ncbi:High-affinity nicotinic acid transporter [Pseudocercospora fuligena]|uniref:High-affinity nicotinic acid transporter n=1 Tax=Pseudocercospora fuligena TaxID=685502 RepID=A0A8H6REA8_9PEZI|nr:High-affinity nicotinic acid transporter [Pseudocercospora fuligena]
MATMYPKQNDSTLEKLESKDVTEREVDAGRSSSSNSVPITIFNEKEQRRIIWHIDRRVVAVLGAMYAVSLIDRFTTGVALITGMGVDLELKGSRYNMINAMFFVPYVLFQLPATVLLRKIGARYFLSITTFLWGATTICCGFVSSWTDLMALRMCLGLWEAGFFPSCLYLLSSWYPRYDLQKRNAGFFLLGLVPSAFCGIMAYGISHMGGLGSGPEWWGKHNIEMSPAGIPIGISYGGGIAGWRWIFIIFGAITCAIAIWGYFWSWISLRSSLWMDLWGAMLNFSPRRKHLGLLIASKRIGTMLCLLSKSSPLLLEYPVKLTFHRFNILEYIKYAGDLKVWGFALMYGLVGLIGYGIGFALPMLLMDTMGFSVAKAQCLSTPPYLLAAIVTWFVAVYSDKWRLRSPFILACLVLVFIGLCLIGFASNHGAQYFGVFFAALPQCAMVPALLTWQANNIRGQWKRALVSAFSVGAGAAGGLGGSFIFKTEDKPHFYPGIATCLAATFACIVVVLLLLLKFIRANKRAAAGGKPIEGLEGFRYTL